MYLGMFWPSESIVAGASNSRRRTIERRMMGARRPQVLSIENGLSMRT